MLKKISTLVLATSLLLPALSSASVPTLAYTFDTNVKAVNLSNSQRDKLNRAEANIKDIIASESFRSQILNHKYNGKKTFKDNGGLTNSQIYAKILAGAEKLSPAQNNTLDAEVAVYFENSNTVGFTMTNSKRINMNTKFFNKYTSGEVSGNLMHEWMHKLGFKHDVKATKAREYSVPYAVGAIIRKLAANL